MSEIEEIQAIFFNEKELKSERYQFSQLRVPVVRIPPRKPSHIPTKDNIEGPIFQLIEEGEIILSGGNHELVYVTPTSPHHPDGSDVLWVAERNKDGRVKPWSDESWKEVAEDTEFLKSIEEAYDASSRTERLYTFIGFAVPSHEPLHPAIVPRALQTQRRPHIHSVCRHFPRIKPSYYLSPRNKNSFDSIVMFTNIAADKSIDYWMNNNSNIFDGFGTRNVYRQTVYAKDNTVRTFDHTIFTFDSLQSAIQSSLELRERIDRTVWRRHIEEVLNKDSKRNQFLLKQSIEPNVAIVLPTEEDKRKGFIESEDPVFVFPFCVDPIGLLTGVVLRR